MRPNPTTLAFDTSAAHCAVALFVNGDCVVETTEHMTRGQAERLMPLLQNTLLAQSMTWSDLNLIAVGIGPGNFTGIRIAVSAARGLALGLGIPAIGVSMFDVLQTAPTQTVALTAPRGFAYAQDFQGGLPQGAPRMCDPAQAADLTVQDAPSDTARRIGQIAVNRWINGDAPPRPAPLYVRPPDAAPARDAGPRIIA